MESYFGTIFAISNCRSFSIGIYPTFTNILWRISHYLFNISAVTGPFIYAMCHTRNHCAASQNYLHITKYWSDSKVSASQIHSAITPELYYQLRFNGSEWVFRFLIQDSCNWHGYRTIATEYRYSFETFIDVSTSPGTIPQSTLYIYEVLSSPWLSKSRLCPCMHSTQAKLLNMLVGNHIMCIRMIYGSVESIICLSYSPNGTQLVSDSA